MNRLTPFARFICLVSLVFGIAMGLLVMWKDVVTAEARAERAEQVGFDAGFDVGYKSGQHDMMGDMLESFNDTQRSLGECLEREMKCQGIFPEDAHPH